MRKRVPKQMVSDQFFKKDPYDLTVYAVWIQLIIHDIMDAGFELAALLDERDSLL